MAEINAKLPESIRAFNTADFIDVVLHTEGFNGAEVCGALCFDQNEKKLIAVYPHGWHHVEKDSLIFRTWMEVES